jgi:DNA-binding NarL/FixJ family response regulator
MRSRRKGTETRGRRADVDDISAQSKRRTRIVVVDDNAAMRVLLTEILSGVPDLEIVGACADGQTAIETTARLRPDVVFVDVSMPGLDGIETTRRIAAQFPSVRVIGLSAYEESVMRETMRSAGADGFVSKSASADQIIAAARGRAL